MLLVEKTDRLYRNLKDWVTVDELDVEIHFPKEGVVLSRESRSSEKFMHGIKVLMAKNYIDNLSEEARKGMEEKAEQGIWPTVAPLGYRNITGPDGKKIIEPDPEIAPLVSRLFEWYAAGTLSLREAARKVRVAGLVHRKSGAPVPVSTVVHQGGQAIVGAFNSEGGGENRSEGQPHAKLTHAPVAPLWSPNADAQPMPVTRDGERPLSDARRQLPRRPKGKSQRQLPSRPLYP